MPILVLIASTLVFWSIYWFVRMGGIDHYRERSARRKDDARRAHAREVNDRLTHSRFIAGRAQGFAQAAGLFAGLFKKQLTASERGELVGLMENVARIDGPSESQTAEIERLKRLVGLASAA